MKTTEERMASILHKVEIAKAEEEKSRKRKRIIGITGSLIAAVICAAILLPNLNLYRNNQFDQKMAPRVEDKLMESPEKVEEKFGTALPEETTMEEAAPKMDDAQEEAKEAINMADSAKDTSYEAPADKLFQMPDSLIVKTDTYKKVPPQNEKIPDVLTAQYTSDRKNVYVMASKRLLDDGDLASLPPVDDNDDKWEFVKDKSKQYFHIRSGQTYLGGEATNLTSEELRSFLLTLITENSH